MESSRSLQVSAPLLACFMLLASAAAVAADDVLVPAHRTRDGSYVPANVAPLSAGSRLARRPTRARPEAASHSPTRPAAASPLFARAAPIRR